MTERLYYTDSYLFDFEATVLEAAPAGERMAVVLDRSAFYPTSGGQLFDTGTLRAGERELGVVEVGETNDGNIVHYVAVAPALTPGTRVRGTVDAARRLDHMQQHSGQHVLSAAFVRLFQMPTVSFHMGDDSSTIDLETASLSHAQVVEAERLSNQIIAEDRPVEICMVGMEEARALGVRKLPERGGELRLIDIRDFDLNACGGTHVVRTGQIGALLLRKTEKVRQGYRVEFVCGLRAVRNARRDFETLTEAAGALSTHIWELPQQVAKALEEAKQQRKREQRLLEEIAELEAARLLAETPPGARRLISKIYGERDLAFAKLVAHKLIAAAKVVVLLGAGRGQPGVVVAQSEGGELDAGKLLKEALAEFGGRGGGSREMAQGGVPDAEKLAAAIASLRGKLS